VEIQPPFLLYCVQAGTVSLLKRAEDLPIQMSARAHLQEVAGWPTLKHRKESDFHPSQQVS
jgi:hypothetical protein